MPRGNGTGPIGEGPMTGRGMGLCNGSDTPGATTAEKGGIPWGGGRGRAFGGGRGFSRGFGFKRACLPTQNSWQAASKTEEKDYVSNEIKALENEIAELKAYLTTLDKQEK